MDSLPYVDAELRRFAPCLPLSPSHSPSSALRRASCAVRRVPCVVHHQVNLISSILLTKTLK